MSDLSYLKDTPIDTALLAAFEVAGRVVGNIEVLELADTIIETCPGATMPEVRQAIQAWARRNVGTESPMTAEAILDLLVEDGSTPKAARPPGIRISLWRSNLRARAWIHTTSRRSRPLDTDARSDKDRRPHRHTSVGGIPVRDGCERCAEDAQRREAISAYLAEHLPESAPPRRSRCCDGSGWVSHQVDPRSGNPTAVDRCPTCNYLPELTDGSDEGY